MVYVVVMGCMGCLGSRQLGEGIMVTCDGHSISHVDLSGTVHTQTLGKCEKFATRKLVPWTLRRLQTNLQAELEVTNLYKPQIVMYVSLLLRGCQGAHISLALSRPRVEEKEFWVLVAMQLELSETMRSWQYARPIRRYDHYCALGCNLCLMAMD